MLRLSPVSMYADAITPAELRSAYVVLLPSQRRPSRNKGSVGFRIFPFEACSAFTARYGLLARGVASTTLCTEGFDCFVTSTAAPVATGWNDQLPGGNYTH